MVSRPNVVIIEIKAMNERIRLIAASQFKRKKDFAEHLGWKPNYLSKILGGQNIGLRPILEILEKMPNISARWLLFGEGAMYCTK